MFRLAAVVLPLSVSACGAVGVAENHQPSELTRRQAAGQFVCHEQNVEVRDLGNSEYQATGCGKTATWTCSGDSDGHTTIDILDRRCRRISEPTSQWGGSIGTRDDASDHVSAKSSSREMKGRRPFPRDDVKTALRAAARGLRACREPSAPTAFDAHLRFEPSGKVASVVIVSNETPRDDVASCVKTRLAEVSLTPFDGEPVTVKMRVEL